MSYSGGKGTEPEQLKQFLEPPSQAAGENPQLFAGVLAGRISNELDAA